MKSRFCLLLSMILLLLGSATVYAALPPLFLRVPSASATDILALPALRALANQGGVALLNTAVAASVPADAEVISSNELGARLVRLSTLPTGTTIVLAADQPPPGHLGFVLMVAPDVPAGSVLTSPSTRTRGLIAALDLTDAGQLPQALPSQNALAELRALDRQVRATHAATIPVLVGYGLFAIGTGLALVLTLALALTRGVRHLALLRSLQSLLVVAALVPLALLPTGVRAPQPWPLYAAVTVCSALILTLATAVLACRFSSTFSFLRTALALLTLGILLDASFGAPLVARSLLSGYYLAGVRYYGIGNEYMGLLIGAALIASPARLLPWTGLAVTLALGLPFLGANAGGAIAAVVTFTVAVCAQRGPLRARHILTAFGLAAISVVLLAFSDRLLPHSVQSHMGRAIQAGESGGAGALAAIALRKLTMNLRIATTGYALAAVAAMVPIWWLLARGPAGERTRQAIERRPELARRLPAALWGALAALLFNDSGIVAFLLLLAPVTAIVVDSSLCDFSAWISEPNASGSP